MNVVTAILFPAQSSRRKDLRAWAYWRYSLSDQDRGWDWRSIFASSQRSPERFECYSAWSGNVLQGLLALDLKYQRTREGAAIVVEYLAANPDNRKTNEGLKHVGVALVGVAITRSLESGTEGRLWLESLPDATGFYENLEFEKQARKSADGYAVYVLISKKAKSLLEEIKFKGILKS